MANQNADERPPNEYIPLSICQRTPQKARGENETLGRTDSQMRAFTYCMYLRPSQMGAVLPVNRVLCQVSLPVGWRQTPSREESFGRAKS